MKKGGKQLVQQTIEYPLPIFFRTEPQHQLPDCSLEEGVELLLERGVPYLIRRKDKEGIVLVKRNGHNGSFMQRLSCLEDKTVDYMPHVRIRVDPPNLFVQWNGRGLFLYKSPGKGEYVQASPLVFHRMEAGEYWFQCGTSLQFCIMVPELP